LVTLNKHEIKDYLLEEAGIFGGETDICGICDSWFCILRDRLLHYTMVIEKIRARDRTLTDRTVHTMGFFLKAGLFRRLVFRVLRHHFLGAAARWRLTSGWNVTECHFSRDFLMPSTDSEQLWCCYVENVSHWPRTSLPSAKGGSDERNGSFLTSGGWTSSLQSDRGLRHHPHCEHHFARVTF